MSWKLLQMVEGDEENAFKRSSGVKGVTSLDGCRWSGLHSDAAVLRVTRHGEWLEMAHSTGCSPSYSPLHSHAACSMTHLDAQTATGEACFEMVIVCGGHVPKKRWRRESNSNECSNALVSTRKRGSNVKLVNHTSTDIHLVLPQPVNFGRCVSSFNDKSTRLKFGSEW
ncbi:hypothetical protein BLNAU_22558 [Blattamonas nauphoetae]|uniref:Uncharacterized protein n=1 Tax=Blattamonas nauphoetae TaxID=2049346 RepID=A0ABQ9WSQ8_9EUKA|nr:hypothetical protein BLNAU_22558 [Blattamonas nauphoetae]